MEVKKYRFAGLVFSIAAPTKMLCTEQTDSFLTEDCATPDFSYHIFPETGEIVSQNPIRVERHGNELNAYMDTQLLPEISVFSFLCGAGAARLLPETGRFLLHASYIVHDGQAILFTAPSGTGKSTQAHFWQERCGAKIVNEDRVILSQLDGRYYANGCWAAGTAGLSRNVTAPVRCIVLLGQGKEDRVSIPGAVEALRRLIPQCTFDDASVSGRVAIVDALSQLIGNVPILSYECREHIGTVDELKRWI